MASIANESTSAANFIQLNSETGHGVAGAAAGAAAVAVAAGAHNLHHRLVTVPKEARQEEVKDLVQRHLGQHPQFDLSGDYVRPLLRLPDGVCHHIRLQTALELLCSYLTKLSAPRVPRDPRTRRIITSLLHAWFREHVGKECLVEEDVKSIANVLRDIMYRPTLFVHSSMQRKAFGIPLMDFRKMIAEVYQQVQWQLGEVLAEEKSCARICQFISVLFNNNVEVGVIQYLLQSGTSWTGLDNLPSLQMSILYRSLPMTAAKEDANLRKDMKVHWATDVGTLIATLLCISPNVGSGVREATGATTPPAAPFLQLLDEVRVKWSLGDLDACGLAGFLQEQQMICVNDGATRLAEPLANFLDCLQLLSELIYLQKDVFSKFLEVSNAFGDYGCCRVQPLLHPFLTIMTKKCKSLADKLQSFNDAVEEHVVRARNLGVRVPKPLPSEKMSRNADAVFNRMVKGEGPQPAHLVCIQQQVRLLEDRSSQERLPELKKAMKGLMTDLLTIFTSDKYRECAGADFVLPPSPLLLEAESQQSEVLQNALAGVGLDEGIYVDDLVEEQDCGPSLFSPARPRASSCMPIIGDSLSEDALDKVVTPRSRAATGPKCGAMARQSVEWKWHDRCLSIGRWSQRQTSEQATLNFHRRLTTDDALRPVKVSVNDLNESIALTCITTVSGAAESLAGAASSKDTSLIDVLSKDLVGKAILSARARWMWADAGLTNLIPSYRHIARKSPWRWSQAIDLKGTIADLEEQRGLPEDDRPVRLEVWTSGPDGKRVTYAATSNGIDAAIYDLRRLEARGRNTAGALAKTGRDWKNRRTACVSEGTPSRRRCRSDESHTSRRTTDRLAGRPSRPFLESKTNRRTACVRDVEAEETLIQSEVASHTSETLDMSFEVTVEKPAVSAREWLRSCGEKSACVPELQHLGSHGGSSILLSGRSLRNACSSILSNSCDGPDTARKSAQAAPPGTSIAFHPGRRNSCVLGDVC